MDIREIIEFFMNLDGHIVELIDFFGIGAYAILFFIIFLETGAVVLAILPGDSLLVGAGAFGATGDLNILALLLGFFLATVLGDMLNFKIGQILGRKYHRSKYEDRSLFKFINKDNFEKVHNFFTNKGRRAFLISRFIPIARTLTPFTAGFTDVNFLDISLFMFMGNAIWTSLYVMIGYFMGNMDFLDGRFIYLMAIIFIISMIPAAFFFIRNRFRASARK
ncbi:VTT domain-containing protein [Proteiniclasticum sp. SCR006]|uniref:VTT domain-containing protein n=1 Tax=Proteiniclasticum aestuarii TaxID=2817862 RepID=A0A939KK84_9CLOT|nr:VTT domain-containing protein [Proteiniclasticum aestuarii]MBO1264465.1 VTT domain-containing protein [Proteiniclasticum aestuarii]